jgi:hypothetical protein
MAQGCKFNPKWHNTDDDMMLADNNLAMLKLSVKSKWRCPSGGLEL